MEIDLWGIIRNALKKFITSQVTVGDVRDFYGALADRLASGKGYFITTNKFNYFACCFPNSRVHRFCDFKLVLQRLIRLALN